MNFILKPRGEDSPYLQLAYIAGLALGGLVVLSVIAVGVIISWYGIGALSDPAVLSGYDPKFKPALRMLVVASSLGLFLFPALMLPIVQGRRISEFYGMKAPSLKLLLLTILVMAVSAPFMEWTALTNQQMSFPPFLRNLEAWMREKENDALRTTILLLEMGSFKDLLINLLMIALLPAIAEELLFRAALQRTAGRIFKNHHVSIWVAAVVFSAIHLQFYGFVPRLLLGAGFGYLYFWSGSLWYAIAGHFLNNAYAVSVAWYMQRHHMPDWTKADATPHFNFYGYAASFVLLIFALYLFRRQALNSKKQSDTYK